MDVSKLSISQETVSKVNRMYTPKQKRYARFEGIKRLIEESNGRKLAPRELYAAAGFLIANQNQRWNAAAFIKNAKKSGILTKLDTSMKSRYSIDMSKINAPRKNAKVVNVSENDLVSQVINKKESSEININVKGLEEKTLEEKDFEVPQVEIDSNDGREFSFSIDINEKRDHSYRKLGSLDMNEVSKDTMIELVNNLINKI